MFPVPPFGLTLLLALLLAGCAAQRTDQPPDWMNNYYDDQSTGGVGPSFPGATGGNTMIINQGKVTVPK